MAIRIYADSRLSQGFYIRCSQWETCVARYDERPAQAQVRVRSGADTVPQMSRGVPVDSALHANETVSRLVAYASPYIFWVTVACLSIAIVVMQ